MRAKTGFLEEMDRSRGDIHRFSRNIMRFHPTGQQKDLLDLVQYETFAPVNKRKKGIFVASGQGCGKTSSAAVIAAWRLLQVRGSKVVVISPTMRQVRDIFMGELDVRVQKAHPELAKFLKVTSTNATACGDKSWRLLTMTSTRPENVQGQHRQRMTIIADEASGIERPIWQVLKGTLTEEDNLLIAIGNPNERDTEFFDAFYKDVHLYHTLNWSSEDSPNVDRRSIEKMEAEYGRESDIFRVRVLGQFPREKASAVIRYEDLLFAARKKDAVQAMKKPVSTDPKGRLMVRQIGIDLARFGGDESSITFRCNGRVLGSKHFLGEEPGHVIAFAMDWQHRMRWRNEDVTYCVDAGGVGQGVLHMLYDAGKRVFEFHSQGVPAEPNTYKDAVTEAYFTLRQITRAREVRIIEDVNLFSQLVSREYRFDKGLFRLESKDEYIDRIGRHDFNSPDRADSLALAFYPYAGSEVRVR